MKIRFPKPAQFELEDAVAWYDSHAVGLGTQFLDDLDRTARRIVAYPFGIIYGVDNDTIVIVAIAHLHREPRYWADRLTNK